MGTQLQKVEIQYNLKAAGTHECGDQRGRVWGLGVRVLAGAQLGIDAQEARAVGAD